MKCINMKIYFQEKMILIWFFLILSLGCNFFVFFIHAKQIIGELNRATFYRTRIMITYLYSTKGGNAEMMRLKTAKRNLDLGWFKHFKSSDETQRNGYG